MIRFVHTPISSLSSSRRKFYANLALVTGTLAFLALTLGDVQSTGGSQPPVDPFAQSSITTILGDLNQEIIDGSTATTPTSGVTLYAPKVPASSTKLSTMAPALVGFSPTYFNGTETDGLANLLKISKRNSPFYNAAVNANYAKTGSLRASSVNSTTDVSVNGRKINASRWNSHFLLARANPVNGSLDSTPVANFPNPDWVIVTRGGANTAYTNANINSLKDPSTNNYAVGRFAYAIYNEGGLLDMNVAGYPGTDISSGSQGLTTQQVSQKGVLALADLTQLPVSVSNPTALLTQAQINNIVGWRNYATAQPSGSFPNYVFDPSSATRYFNAVHSNATGFLTPSSATFNGQSDQQFTSRQQLLSLTESLSISPDVLQYLGTFSRSLEQPSYAPDPNRPRVINKSLSPPPVGGPTGNNEDNYLGNNDAASGDDLINPAFLSVRVGTIFTRFNGTLSVVGEPLVKTKFALSKLAMVAYNATNASLPAGFQPTASDPDPIYDRFGLRRTNPSAPWVYNHGIMSGNGIPIIGTLSMVAAARREPDFAELLKAAITTGSLAKGGPGLSSSYLNNYQYTLDTSVDYQVLQIMANLIDQQDADSYPTGIQIQVGVNNQRNIYGVEDLPYFYRFHLFSVVDRLPNPVCPTGSNVTFQPPPSGSMTTGSCIATAYPPAVSPATSATMVSTWNVVNPTSVTINQAMKGNLLDPGEATYLYVIDVWNPHDTNTLATSSNLRPVKFRIFAQTQDPLGGGAWSIGAENLMTGSGQSSLNNVLPQFNGFQANCINWPNSTQTYLTSANTALTFSDNEGKLFREPTLLWNNNIPGVNLSYAGTTSGLGSIQEANTGKTYYGIIAGKVPVSMQATFSTTGNPNNPVPSTDGTYVIQGSSLSQTSYLPPVSYPQITFVLQYQDPNNPGNWITYDSKYPDLHGMVQPSLVVNTDDFRQAWRNPLRNSQLSDHAIIMDPRTARWGMGTDTRLGQNALSTNAAPFTLESTPFASFKDNSSSGNTAVGNSNFSVVETQRPRADSCDSVSFSTPGMTSDPGKNKYMRWFSGTGYNAAGGSVNSDSPLYYGGLFSQNLPGITLVAKDGVTTANLYVEDADGMPRPAMGGYAYAPVVSAPLAIQEPIQDARAMVSPHRIGLPMATANTFGNNAIGTPTTQSQSRPLVLNRPFRSVSDMSYTFTGTPWKNIDFFTPASGDSALLDVFCVNETPSPGLVAGKVDLNTRQAPVLKSILAGAYRDELDIVNANFTGGYAITPPASTLPPLTPTESGLIAAKLTEITTATDIWRGPLTNVGDLVGRFVARMPSSGALTQGAIGTDWFTYTPPTSGYPAFQQTSILTSFGYEGLSAVLGNDPTYGVYTTAAGTSATGASTALIQRFREAGIRPLADCGQTRVWNLMIDVVAQTGNYPFTATDLTQFYVTGEHHYWQHVAIDRFTGQILDQNVEEVAETPDEIQASNLTTGPGTAAGTTIGSFNALPGGTFTYTLVSGPGGEDNAYFTIVGNTLQTIANLNVPGKTSYTILVQVTGSNGQSYQQSFTITIGPIGTQDTPTLPLWAFLAMTLLFLGVAIKFLPNRLSAVRVW